LELPYTRCPAGDPCIVKNKNVDRCAVREFVELRKLAISLLQISSTLLKGAAPCNNLIHARGANIELRSNLRRAFALPVKVND